MEAGSRSERNLFPGDVVLAGAFQDVDDFVVGMAVLGRFPGWDHADELRYVEAAGLLVDQVPELAVGRGRQRRLVSVTHRHTPRLSHAELARGRSYRRHDHVLVGRDAVRLAGSDERRRPRLEHMLLPVELERPLAGDDEQHLLPVAGSAFARPPPRKTDNVLLEPLAAVRGVDGGPDLSSVAGRLHARDVLLRDNEALCDPHPDILPTHAHFVNGAVRVAT